MSQFIAMGIIEALSFHRLVWLSVRGLALVLGGSGIGSLVLAACGVAAVALRMVLRAALVVVFATVPVGVVSLMVPEVADIAQSRLGEFDVQGTRGHGRFVAPFWVLSDGTCVSAGDLFGMGTGTSQNLTAPCEYSINTPIKV